ncbi:homeobox-containing protein 1-like isoform X3 [Dermacentor variabilis]|uniref:homeobox-containing protein 1-like isoform X3 n=1 Tax=Dermacentor variabilis TaxID=34621 RepID=UPI003F5C5746
MMSWRQRLVSGPSPTWQACSWTASCQEGQDPGTRYRHWLVSAAVEAEAAAVAGKRSRMAGILFTIEQIELIRRLRASGITRDQVMMAFEQLDRLDMELGSAAPCPVMPALMPRGRSNYGGGGGGGGGGDSHGGAGGGSGGHNGLLSSSAAARSFLASREPPQCPALHQLQNASSNDSATGDCGPHNGESVASPPTTTAASSSAKLPSELTIIPISANASPQGGNEDHGGYGGSGGGGGGASSNMYPAGVVPMQYLMNPHEFLQEESGDIDELKRKGEAAILSEIRNFVMRYNIKQTMIAEMTKLSQAYVSRFFRGDIADMSERTKNTFYMWYLTCKNNPWKLAQLCPNSGVKRMVSETGDLIPLKRERFTFKSAHLAVLERYYERDPYPDAQTREQIVEECNEAVERPERPLTEREKVSLPVVNNWFNNRRKEAKKQLRQQHAAAMAAAAQAGGLGGLGSVQAALAGGGHQKSPFSVGPPLWGAPSLYPQVGSSAAALAAALPSCAAGLPTSSPHVEAPSMRGGGSDQGDSAGPEGDSDQGDSDTSQEEDSTSLPSYGHDSEPADFTTNDNNMKPVIKQEMPSSQCVSSMEQDDDG